jgi:hypothetical protein
VLPLAWWVVGDKSDDSAPPSDLMYLVHPPDIGAGVGAALFLVGTAVALVLSAYVCSCVRQAHAWFLAASPVVLAWLVGFGWGFFARSLTMGAGGATMSLIVVPLAPVLVIVQGAAVVLTAALSDPGASGTAHRAIP